MSYRYLEDIALADIAFEAEAPTPSELFAEAWAATLAVMTDRPDALAPSVERGIALSTGAIDLLLFDFLGRLVYYKDAEQLLLRLEAVAVEERGAGWSLTARLAGERIDPARHELGVDVKAVTLHRLSVARAGAGWRAVVVLDV